MSYFFFFVGHLVFLIYWIFVLSHKKTHFKLSVKTCIRAHSYFETNRFSVLCMLIHMYMISACICFTLPTTPPSACPPPVPYCVLSSSCSTHGTCMKNVAILCFRGAVFQACKKGKTPSFPHAKKAPMMSKPYYGTLIISDQLSSS